MKAGFQGCLPRDPPLSSLVTSTKSQRLGQRSGQTVRHVLTASTGPLLPLYTAHMYSIIMALPVGSTSPIWDAPSSPYASGREAEQRLGTCTLSCP
jgi:hypothetical protein